MFVSFCSFSSSFILPVFFVSVMFNSFFVFIFLSSPTQNVFKNVVHIFYFSLSSPPLFSSSPVLFIACPLHLLSSSPLSSSSPVLFISCPLHLLSSSSPVLTSPVLSSPLLSSPILSYAGLSYPVLSSPCLSSFIFVLSPTFLASLLCPPLSSPRPLCPILPVFPV